MANRYLSNFLQSRAISQLLSYNYRSKLPPLCPGFIDLNEANMAMCPQLNRLLVNRCPSVTG